MIFSMKTETMFLSCPGIDNSILTLRRVSYAVDAAVRSGRCEI